jgi:uncharacterized protein YeaO (DUF488 family)
MMERADEKLASGGLRLLVGWFCPRGLSQERDAVTLPLGDVAPSPVHRRWFEHSHIRWKEFPICSRSELRSKKDVVKGLGSRAGPDDHKGPAT